MWPLSVLGLAILSPFVLLLVVILRTVNFLAVVGMFLSYSLMVALAENVFEKYGELKERFAGAYRKTTLLRDYYAEQLDRILDIVSLDVSLTVKD